LDDLIKKLEQSISRDDFIDIAYDIVDELDELDDAVRAVAPILKLMETHPDVDFGTPGPLVHFVEQFYRAGYEEQLLLSLKRCPTEHMVWMMRRVLNGMSESEQQRFITDLSHLL